jgi:uncharacterized protein (DUF2461 family)
MSKYYQKKIDAAQDALAIAYEAFEANPTSENGEKVDKANALYEAAIEKTPSEVKAKWWRESEENAEKHLRSLREAIENDPDLMDAIETARERDGEKPTLN